jgi:hypothetical protein
MGRCSPPCAEAEAQGMRRGTQGATDGIGKGRSEGRAGLQEEAEAQNSAEHAEGTRRVLDGS